MISPGVPDGGVAEGGEGPLRGMGMGTGGQMGGLLEPSLSCALGWDGTPRSWLWAGSRTKCCVPSLSPAMGGPQEQLGTLPVGGSPGGLSEPLVGMGAPGCRRGLRVKLPVGHVTLTHFPVDGHEFMVTRAEGQIRPPQRHRGGGSGHGPPFLAAGPPKSVRGVGEQLVRANTLEAKLPAALDLERQRSKRHFLPPAPPASPLPSRDGGAPNPLPSHVSSTPGGYPGREGVSCWGVQG